MSAPVQDRFERLVSLHLDGVASPDETSELAALSTDPERASLLQELGRLDIELRGVLAAPMSDDSLFALVRQEIAAPPGEGHEAPSAGIMKRVRRDARLRSAMRLGAGLAAACAAAAVILVVVARPFGERRDPGKGPATLTGTAPRALTGPDAFAPDPTALESGRGRRRWYEGLSSASFTRGGVLQESTLVARHDFEGGEPRDILEAGNIARCPPGGSSRCLAGEKYDPTTPSLGVRLADGTRGLFVYSDELVVTFDYWMGEFLGQPPYIHVSFVTDGNAEEYVVRLTDAGGGGWRRAVAVLAAGRPYDIKTRPVPGTMVRRLKIRTSTLLEDVFYVDNIEVRRLDAAVLRGETR